MDTKEILDWLLELQRDDKTSDSDKVGISLLAELLVAMEFDKAIENKYIPIPSDFISLIEE